MLPSIEQQNNSPELIYNASQKDVASNESEENLAPQNNEIKTENSDDEIIDEKELEDKIKTDEDDEIIEPTINKKEIPQELISVILPEAAAVDVAEIVDLIDNDGDAKMKE